ncbi:helix-turn-helix domain-containing protein [Enterococcus nangangensis]|uniref:helix-turn-helix domain-containing protein n=1 Tax=Enterococcus nangangensis TaxID=2559926 RepID=UPI0010F598EA|nr:helix-turn-helix transcriptional regulator [Enterococcus nangangensis]
MALVHGEIIKAERKKRKMSQTELAEGICKQATISNIERKNFCKDIEILAKVCRKLDLVLTQVVEASPEDWLEERLAGIEDQLASGHAKEALVDLEKIKNDDIEDRRVLNRYYYNFGNALLQAKKDTDGALFYYNQVINNTNADELYGILANTGIAVTYGEKKQPNFAETYFQKALAGIKNNSKPYPLHFNQVFLDAAKFYNSNADFDKAISATKKALEINQSYHSTQLLDQIIFENARSEKGLNKETSAGLFDFAAKLAEFNQNKRLAKKILEEK